VLPAQDLCLLLIQVPTLLTQDLSLLLIQDLPPLVNAKDPSPPHLGAQGLSALLACYLSLVLSADLSLLAQDLSSLHGQNLLSHANTPLSPGDMTKVLPPNKIHHDNVSSIFLAETATVTESGLLLMDVPHPVQKQLCVETALVIIRSQVILEGGKAQISTDQGLHNTQIDIMVVPVKESW